MFAGAVKSNWELHNNKFHNNTSKIPGPLVSIWLLLYFVGLSKLVISGPRDCVIDWLVVVVSSMDLCDCALAHLFGTLPENMICTKPKRKIIFRNLSQRLPCWLYHMVDVSFFCGIFKDFTMLQLPNLKFMIEHHQHQHHLLVKVPIIQSLRLLTGKRLRQCNSSAKALKPRAASEEAEGFHMESLVEGYRYIIYTYIYIWVICIQHIL